MLVAEKMCFLKVDYESTTKKVVINVLDET